MRDWEFRRGPTPARSHPAAQPITLSYYSNTLLLLLILLLVLLLLLLLQYSSSCSPAHHSVLLLQYSTTTHPTTLPPNQQELFRFPPHSTSPSKNGPGGKSDRLSFGSCPSILEVNTVIYSKPLHWTIFLAGYHIQNIICSKLLQVNLPIKLITASCEVCSKLHLDHGFHQSIALLSPFM